MKELKRAIINSKMLFSVLCATGIMIIPMFTFRVWGQREDVDILYLITFPMALSGFTPFACIFPMLPYGLAFTEEYNSGYIRMELFRFKGGRRSYMARKILCCALSGGCAMAFAFALVFILCTAGGKAVTSDTLSEFYLFTVWKPYAFIWGGRLVLIMKLILAFFYGAVWALIMLLVSSVYTNRYVAIMVPFVLYQITWALLQGRPYNPVYLLRGDWGGYSFWLQPVCIDTGIIVITILLTVFFMRRKLYDI